MKKYEINPPSIGRFSHFGDQHIRYPKEGPVCTAGRRVRCGVESACWEASPAVLAVRLDDLQISSLWSGASIVPDGLQSRNFEVKKLKILGNVLSIPIRSDPVRYGPSGISAVGFPCLLYVFPSSLSLRVKLHSSKWVANIDSRAGAADRKRIARLFT